MKFIILILFSLMINYKSFAQHIIHEIVYENELIEGEDIFYYEVEEHEDELYVSSLISILFPTEEKKNFIIRRCQHSLSKESTCFIRHCNYDLVMHLCDVVKCGEMNEDKYNNCKGN